MTEKHFHPVHASDAEREKRVAAEQKYALQFQKEKTALKFYMIGKNYILGLKALGFLERYSADKKRKDGKTPEMHHMIRIAFAVTQLKGVIDEETCIILALLHDIQEDEDVPREEMVKFFNDVIAAKNWKLTKKFCGVVKNKTEFMEALANDREASIVKGLDRCDNLEHMVGVFDAKKMESYCHEAETLYLKMLHSAAKNFPEQQIAYYTIRTRMKRAVKAASDLIDAFCIHEIVREELAKVQEEKDLFYNDSVLSAQKLMKAYKLTDSNTYEEHKNRILSLVANTMDMAKEQGITDQAPEILSEIDKKRNIELFYRLNKSVSKVLRLPLPVPSFGCKSTPVKLSTMINDVLMAELGVSSLELQKFVDETEQQVKTK